MAVYHTPWQLLHRWPTSMDKQPPPDAVVKELQALHAHARRLLPSNQSERLLTNQLTELIAAYGLVDVLRVLAIIQRHMDLSPSSPGDPRR